MRCLALLLLTSLASGQNAGPTVAAGSIEGQVLDGVTGQPVRKASVYLHKKVSLEETRSDYLATTDAAGKYVFRELAPGTYGLSAGKNEYITASFGDRSRVKALVVSTGEAIKLDPFRLMPTSAISGRVVDEDGDGVPGLEMRLWRQSYSEGKRGLIGIGLGTNKTDDRGIFRIANLDPGKYYVSAKYLYSSYPKMAEEATSYVSSFYPGVTEVDAAAPITLASGVDRDGIDIRLPKKRTYHVTGVVKTLAGGEVPDVTLTLFPRDLILYHSDEVPTARATWPEGKFQLTRVPAGTYILIAATRGERGTEGAYIHRVVEIGANLDGLNLFIPKSSWIAGQITVEGDTRANLSAAQVFLESLQEGSRGSKSSAVSPDGTFQIESLGPVRYRVTVSGLPSGFYLKSVRAGDRDLAARLLDLTAGAPPSLTLVISPTAAALSGVVRFADVDAPASSASVVLIPQEKDKHEDQTAYVFVSTDEAGRYAISDLRPGEYKVFAWESAPGYREPDFMAPFESKGIALTVPEGGRLKLDLTALPSPNN